jgi:hypothetical protein
MYNDNRLKKIFSWWNEFLKLEIKQTRIWMFKDKKGNIILDKIFNRNWIISFTENLYNTF